MPSLSFFFIIYFLLVVFISDITAVKTDNTLLSYLLVQFQFIRKHYRIFLFLFVTISTLFVFYNLKKWYEIIGRYFRFWFRTSIALLLSLAVAFVTLYLIIFVELNAISIITNLTPKLLGVDTTTEQIIQRLKSTTIPPEVIISSENKNDVSKIIALAQSGKASFYGHFIVSRYPDFLVLPSSGSEDGILMVGNTIIVNKIDSPDFQLVSPYIAYLFIKDYFSNFEIKKYPNVTLMDMQQYKKYRELDFDKKIEVFDQVISKANEVSANLPDTIVNLGDEISRISTSLEDAKSRREKEYIKCVNVGVYEDGVYVRTYSKEECREQNATINEEVKNIETELKNLKIDLEENENLLESYRLLVQYYNDQKILTNEDKSFISYEFASFLPPEEISVSLTLDDSTIAIADYFELIVHEYLHYVTFAPEKEGFTSAFFMEGLTEYFARNIIKRNLGIQTNVAYPVNVKILQQVQKRIAEPDLANIYFSQNQDELVKKINLAYGENFYQDHIVLLETLHYTSDKIQILKLANDIMQEIGGDYLGEEDLQTTYSTFVN